MALPLERAQEIAAYYDGTVDAYRIVWGSNRTMALHFGFWPPGDRSIFSALSRRRLQAALRGQDEMLAQWIGVSEHDRVLDAGCGIGGSSINLCRTRGCEVVGITLSEQQVRQARENAERAGPEVSRHTRFEVRDYTSTGYDAGSFSVVWALESLCHADRKADFCNEAARLLAPGGRLLVADYFATRSTYAQSETSLLKGWLSGWAIRDLPTDSALVQDLQQAGFCNITFRDVTDLVRQSSRRLYLVYLFTTWLLKPFVVDFLGLKPWRLDSEVEQRNINSARFQYEALREGLWRYGVITATR